MSEEKPKNVKLEPPKPAKLTPQKPKAEEAPQKKDTGGDPPPSPPSKDKVPKPRTSGTASPPRKQAPAGKTSKSAPPPESRPGPSNSKPRNNPPPDPKAKPQNQLKKKEAHLTASGRISKVKAQLSGSNEALWLPTKKKSKQAINPDGDNPSTPDDISDDDLPMTGSDLRRVVTYQRRSLRRRRAKSALPTIFTAIDAIYLAVRLILFFYYDAPRLFGDEFTANDEAFNKTVENDFCGKIFHSIEMAWFSMFTWLFYLIGTILLIISIAKLSLPVCYGCIIIKIISLLVLIVELFAYGLQCLSKRFYIDLGIFLCIHLPIQIAGGRLVQPFLKSMTRPSLSLEEQEDPSAMLEQFASFHRSPTHHRVSSTPNHGHGHGHNRKKSMVVVD